MLKFKEFITEEEDLMIDDVPEQLLAQIDTINAELEEITEDPFANSAVFFNLIRNTLERFGIIIPPGYEMPMLSMDSETAYTLGDSGYYIYVVHNTELHGIIGYAQIVNKTDLDDLMSSEMSDVSSGDEQRIRRWIPPARRDDDSGNTTEYPYPDVSGTWPDPVP
jgi:hypothetical protein